MKKIGAALLIVGVLLAIATLMMDTTVVSGDDRIHNLGLMNEKQNYLFASIALAIMGVILFAFGAGRAREAKEISNKKTRNCPYCAEMVMSQARVCKHCGRDIEPQLSENPNDNIESVKTSTLGIKAKKFLTKERSRKLLIGAGAVILAATLVQGVVFLLAPEEPLHYEFESMVTNLADPSGDKIVQLQFALLANDKKTYNSIDGLKYAIKSQLLENLGKKTSEELSGKGGKERVEQEIVNTLEELGFKRESYIVFVHQLIVQ